MATKLLANLTRGDQVVTVRTVKATWASADGTLMTIVYDDDTTEVRSLAGDPAIEVASV